MTQAPVDLSPFDLIAFSTVDILLAARLDRGSLPARDGLTVERYERFVDESDDAWLSREELGLQLLHTNAPSRKNIAHLKAAMRMAHQLDRPLISSEDHFVFASVDDSAWARASPHCCAWSVSRMSGPPSR